MRCDQVQSMLSAFTDGELNSRHAARVSQHLSECATCRSEATALDRVVAALRSLAEEELPAGLHGAIIHALDTARPSLWQRLCAVPLVFQPVRPLAFGTMAVVLTILAVTSTPLQRADSDLRSVAHLSYQGATQPIRVAAEPAAPKLVSPLPVAALPTPAREAETLLPPHANPTIVTMASDAHARQPEPPPRVAQGGRLASTAGHGAGSGRGAAGGGGSRRSPAAPMSTFDPLAPVLDPTGSRTDPPMANVVVAETPPAMPQSESSMNANAPGGAEVTTASAANDDLSSLRHRLSQEPIQLPPVKLKPRPRTSRSLPLLHSDF